MMCRYVRVEDGYVFECALRNSWRCLWCMFVWVSRIRTLHVRKGNYDRWMTMWTMDNQIKYISRHSGAVCSLVWLWKLDSYPDLQQNIPGFRIHILRKRLSISYTDHKPNVFVTECINIYAGCQELHLPLMQRKMLSRFCHTRRLNILPKIIYNVTV